MDIKTFVVEKIEKNGQGFVVTAKDSDVSKRKRQNVMIYADTATEFQVGDEVALSFRKVGG